MLPQGESEVTADFVGEIDHELAVVRRDREPEPRERLRRGARNAGAVAAVLGAVARAEKAVREVKRRAVGFERYVKSGSGVAFAQRHLR